MNRECLSASKLLDKYFDEEATLQERSLVEAHLSECPSCRAALRSKENLSMLIKSPVQEAAGKENFPWVWEKIAKGIQEPERIGLRDLLKSLLDVTPFLKRKIWVPAVATATIFILIMAPLLYQKISSHPALSVVEYVESKTYNVMVYEMETPQMTVIWLFEGPEDELSTS